MNERSYPWGEPQDDDFPERGDEDLLDEAVALLREALMEMVQTTAPRDSFTNCVDKIDAFLMRVPTVDGSR